MRLFARQCPRKRVEALLQALHGHAPAALHLESFADLVGVVPPGAGEEMRRESEEMRMEEAEAALRGSFGEEGVSEEEEDEAAQKEAERMMSPKVARPPPVFDHPPPPT